MDDAIGTAIKRMATITNESALIGPGLRPWRNSTRAGRDIWKQVEVEEASSDAFNYTIKGV
jgi:hypothetical protein